MTPKAEARRAEPKPRKKPAGAHEPASTIALEVVRASGLRLARGKILIPTPRLVAIARGALAKTKALESIDLVCGEGDARLHLVLRMMGNATRVVVRAQVATLHLSADGGALRLRLMESPTFAGKHGGKAGGMIGMLGAVGEAALASMGPERIVATVAELIGPPLSAFGDLLVLDLGAIPAVKRAVQRVTAVGRVGDLIHVTGASFRPRGLEISVRARPRVVIEVLRGRIGGRRSEELGEAGQRAEGEG
jgi:hypothetical protein